MTVDEQDCKCPAMLALAVAGKLMMKPERLSSVVVGTFVHAEVEIETVVGVPNPVIADSWTRGLYVLAALPAVVKTKKNKTITQCFILILLWKCPLGGGGFFCFPPPP